MAHYYPIPVSVLVPLILMDNLCLVRMILQRKASNEFFIMHKYLICGNIALREEQDSDDDSEPETGAGLQKSDTIWQDKQISSFVHINQFRVTKDVTVQRVEYLSEIPSIWPIPETSTAFVVNLQDPKFEITDNAGNLYTVDALIKSNDNDSWRGGTSTADSKVTVTFEPGKPGILCCQSRLNCKGCFACERVDPTVLDVVQLDLDPTSRDAVFAAQWQNTPPRGDHSGTEGHIVHESCAKTEMRGSRLGQPQM
ncbi:hypothetical protein B0H10DRAFT_2386324 [Mycena sp. CBHHK59/15]|nr:hypothetical protein B0H10DRAFT_2386324 [Mycena sp. CBHHK59/15]